MSNFSDIISTVKSNNQLEITDTVFSEETLDYINYSDLWSDSILFLNCKFNDFEFLSCNFFTAQFQNCIFQNSEFFDATFYNASFKNCKLIKCNFTKSEFDRIDFVNCELQEIEFIANYITDSQFIKTSFKNVYFSGVGIFESKIVTFNKTISFKFKSFENQKFKNFNEFENFVKNQKLINPTKNYYKNSTVVRRLFSGVILFFNGFWIITLLIQFSNMSLISN